nr:hypothetical protein [Tanacetum cinerariifolium]
EVQEIRRPEGRDKARAAAKNKGSKSSGSSTMNDDALARLMVNEMTVAEVQQHDAFMEPKRREVVIPTNKIKEANESQNVENPSQKYMQIVTDDSFEFWFMGFVRYEKAFHNLR